jgi:hypothetical protein
MSSTEIMALLETRQREFAAAKQDYAEILASYEQDIYDLHIRVQMAEATEATSIVSDAELKQLCEAPLQGATDGLKVKELEERFPGGTLVLTTATEQLEIEHVYYDIAAYPENWRYQIYSKKLERSVFHFTDLGLSASGKPQLMAEWKGLYIDLSHLF